MEMENAIWGELIKQGTVVAGFVWLLTQFAPLGAKSPGQKNAMAVVYSAILSFTAYLVGAVRIPDIVAPEFTEAIWPKFFVLAIVSLLTAAETIMAHKAGKAVFPSK